MKKIIITLMVMTLLSFGKSISTKPSVEIYSSVTLNSESGLYHYSYNLNAFNIKNKDKKNPSYFKLSFDEGALIYNPNSDIKYTEVIDDEFYLYDQLIINNINDDGDFSINFTIESPNLPTLGKAKYKIENVKDTIVVFVPSNCQFVPEPSSLLLGVLGFVFFVNFRTRKGC